MLSGDKLPALSLPTASQPTLAGSYRSSYPDPTATVPGSNNSSARTSLSGPTSALNDNSRTPPPSGDLAGASTEYGLPPNTVSDSYYPAPSALSSMNHTPPYMDVHSSHLSSAQPYASQAATAGGMSHYSYPQHPPVLQPASTTYGPASSYPQYGYGPVTSPQSATQPPATSMTSQVHAQLLPLPGKTVFLPFWLT